jgi:hypothetical protein
VIHLNPNGVPYDSLGLLRSGYPRKRPPAIPSTLQGLRMASPFDSIPDILLVERDAVSLQHLPELVLKRRLLMMLFL